MRLDYTTFTIGMLNNYCKWSRIWEHIPYGLVVRIPGFHPGGPGSIPGVGTFWGRWCRQLLLPSHWLISTFSSKCRSFSLLVLLLFSFVYVFIALSVCLSVSLFVCLVFMLIRSPQENCPGNSKGSRYSSLLMMKAMISISLTNSTTPWWPSG